MYQFKTDKWTQSAHLSSCAQYLYVNTLCHTQMLQKFWTIKHMFAPQEIEFAKGERVLLHSRPLAFQTRNHPHSYIKDQLAKRSGNAGLFLSGSLVHWSQPGHKHQHRHLINGNVALLSLCLLLSLSLLSRRILWSVAPKDVKGSTKHFTKSDKHLIMAEPKIVETI